MNCPECGHEVQASSVFCGDCGARLPTGAASRSGPGQREADVRALLTRANLLRVRGQWEPAAEQCAAVLRLDPQNAAAHSLLGEIYDNQGYLERAIRWYEEALELSPNSVADRAKLARARELLQSRQRPRSRPAGTAFSWLRVSGVAGTVICGGIILLAVLLADKQPSAPSAAPPFPVPPRTTAQPTVRPQWLTIQERVIGGRVAQWIHPPVQLGMFQLDPRDQSASVGLVLDLATYVENQPPAAFRNRLLKDGYAIAVRVSQEDPAVRRVQIRVAARVRDSAGNLDFRYLFMGSLLCSALLADPEIVTPNDLHGIYREVWWNPEMGF